MIENCKSPTTQNLESQTNNLRVPYSNYGVRKSKIKSKENSKILTNFRFGCLQMSIKLQQIFP